MQLSPKPYQTHN